MLKDELRHDPIRENITKGAQYIQNNQQIVLKIFIGFLIMVAVFSYYNHLRNIKITNAANISGLAQNTFINGNLDEAMVKFERVLTDYPGTTGASQSLIYLINDAISRQDYDTVLKLTSQLKGGIDKIGDPIVRSNIYKIHGDISLSDGDLNNALSYYRNARSSSKGSPQEAKYQLNIISVLISQEDYIQAQKALNNILGNNDVGYNEKNKAEVLLAFVNHKLGT